MENQNLYWIWLTQRKGLGAAGLKALLKGFGTPKAVFEAEEEALARAGVAPALRKSLLDKDLSSARTVLERCAETGVQVAAENNPAYPARLRLQADAPAVLYYKGTLPGEDRPLIGLVGARKADADGLALARRLGREIAACGGLVVTGMAKGIDAMSAAGALEGGGTVIGVLGCGPDIVYPKENAELFARVAERGCLLSEYPPGVSPNARHFPVRNRLISALSDGVAVVRAAEQSGSLITARWAAEQGRDVFAVPGDPADPLSRGCNALLRDGALAAASGWDILRRYEFRYPNTVRMQSAKCKMQNEANPVGAAKTSPACRGGEPASRPVEGCRPQKERAAELDLSGLTPVQRQIAEALLDGPLQLDSLIDKTGLPTAQVLPQLTVLQIKKLISQKPGKIYELT